MNSSPRIGAHLSAAGGILRTLEKAESIGANCMQLFSGSPLRWLPNKLSLEDREKFKSLCQEKDIGPIFIHGVYLINLAADDPVHRGRSEDALIADLTFAESIGGEGVIFHLGSHPSGWSGTKKDALIASFQKILENSPSETSLIVENVAGGGTKIGNTLSQLGQIKDDVRSSRIKFCIDTAHAFESGYDLRTKSTVETFIKEVDRTVRWESVASFHANDSKTKLGSGLDRHENIGEGEIGLEGFRALLTAKETEHISFILETPGFDGKGPDLKNIQILKKLLEEENNEHIVQ